MSEYTKNGEANGASNGTPKPAMNSADEAKFRDLVANMWTSRMELFQRLCGPFSNVDRECNYPDAVQAQFYRDLYDRNPIANRVCNLMPTECWQVTPYVFESDKADKVTPFEEAWDQLGKSLFGEESYYEEEEGSPIWSYLCRADVLSGIGVYGIILMGLDDGKLLQEPVDGVSPDGAPKDISGVGDLQSKDIYGGTLPPNLVQPSPAYQHPLASTMGTDAQYVGTQFSPMQGPKKGNKKSPKLLFLRCFDESLVQVVQYEASMYSPRFGQPVMYLVTLNDPRQPHTGIGLPLATVRVHWSRVIHVAENTGVPSEIFAAPRQQAILNNVLDLKKIYGVSGEGYWRVGFPGMQIKTQPQLGGDVNIDRPALNDMIQDYQQGLIRTLVLMGMDASTISGMVSDPSPHVNAHIEAICIYLKCPVRVFKGSERGELASSQDDAAWNDRLRHRQNTYVTPRIIVPFINRLIAIGVLPKPKRFKVQWPDLDSLGDVQKAQVLLTKTQAYSAAIAGNLFSIVPEHEYMTKFDSMDEDEAQAMLDAAEAQEEKKQQEAQDQADEQGAVPIPPAGFQAPPTPPPGPAGGAGAPPGAAGAKPPVGVPPLPAAGKAMPPPAGGTPGQPAAGADPHAADVAQFMANPSAGSAPAKPAKSAAGQDIDLSHML